MRYSRLALPAVALVLLTLLASCGGTGKAATPPGTTASDKPGSAMPGMSGSGPAGQQPGAPAATNAVLIRDFAFSPATLTVPVGTTVTWTNQDQDPHTVTSTGSGGPLRSPTLQQGQSYRYTFNTPGHYDYLCTIHPFMTATVTVTP